MLCVATSNQIAFRKGPSLHCARHLRDELKQFPNLQAVVILGEDAYRQFQRDVLERRADEIKTL